MVCVDLMNRPNVAEELERARSFLYETTRRSLTSTRLNVEVPPLTPAALWTNIKTTSTKGKFTIDFNH